ncbi:uncharacterized protein LOC122505007 [Leptopilina heterotoma]|uniref:uncharacterized protein LOC122505007 n=1 Tax=Leptopilina heterotoma TaxID=63436 RepID=UPI001CA7BC29|nr:uncharacterized protein LOC122505007 [Leptopilina heterotoma]
MKFKKKVLYFFLFFIQMNNFCLSKVQNYQDAKQTENELLNSEDPFCIIGKLYNDSTVTDTFFENLVIKKLFIIIADDMNDGIMLADFLSTGNRVKFDLEDLFENEVFRQNKIQEHFYLYKSKLKDVHIFVYPTNTPNELLIDYLAKKTIESAQYLKVALICKNDNNTEILNSMFLIASKIFQLDIERHRCEMEYNIIFLPLNINDSTECTLGVKIIKDYYIHSFRRFQTANSNAFDTIERKEIFRSLSKQEQLEYLVIKPLLDDEDHVNNTCSNSPSILENDYLLQESKLIKLRSFLKPETNVINKECFDKIVRSETFFISDLNFLPDWLIFANKNALMIIANRDNESMDELKENLCYNEEILKIFKVICFVSNIFDNHMIWYNYLKQILPYFLKQEKVLSSNLNVCSENDRNTKEIQISNELILQNNIESKLRDFYSGEKEQISKLKKFLFPHSTITREYNCEFMKLYKIFQTIKIFGEDINIKKLFLVIAEDMNDGIELADFMSNNTRVHGSEKLKEKDSKLHTMIMKNYYLYYNKDASTYILVYPRNVTDHLLATYMTKRTIELAKELKIALTCQKEINKFSLESMLLIASEILELDIDNYFTNNKNGIIILPSNIKEDFSYETMRSEFIENYSEKFEKYEKETNLKTWFEESNFKNLHIKEQLEYLILKYLYENSFNNVLLISSYTMIYPIHVHNFLPIESNIITIRYFNSFNYAIPNRCLHEIFLLINGKYAKQNSPSNITSLTGLLTFPTWITKVKQGMCINKNKNDKLITKFIINLCNSPNQIEIVEMICLMRYIEDHDPNLELKLFSLLQHYIINYYCNTERNWFLEIESMYMDRIKHIGKNILLKRLPKFYAEILKTHENKQSIMKEAYNLVFNFINFEIENTCNSINNGTYKLQLRGYILKFSEMLYTQYCPGKVTILEMFAWNKIIIDDDLDSNELQQLILIAPTWEIISNRTIRLDGAPGQSIWKPKTFSDRIYGLHGSPGEPGGSFYGYVHDIINAENLCIVSNGGEGSDGQDGYDLVWSFENIAYQDTYGENVEGKGGKGGISGYITIFPVNITDLKIKWKNASGNYGRSGKVIRVEMDYNHNQQMIIDRENTCQIADRKMKNQQSINSSYVLNADILENNFRTSAYNYQVYTSIMNGGN